MSETRHMQDARSSRPRIQPVREGDDRPLSVSARLGRLQFHHSGKFRVLQLADIQDGPVVAGDTIRLIEASLDAVRPDVVIFTGNQIAGYDPAYAGTFRPRRWEDAGPGSDRDARHVTGDARNAWERTRSLVRGCIARIVQPLVDRGVPWAVTYGNHDVQCGVDLEEMDALYREFPGCLNPPIRTDGAMVASPVADAQAGRQASDGDGGVSGDGRPLRVWHPCVELPDQAVYSCETGTLALPVCDAERTRAVLGLAVVNSGDYARAGGYGSPSRRALGFLESLPGVLGAKSCVFQHLPVAQYYRLLRQVPPTADHAIEGYRRFAGRSYVLDESRTLPGGYLGEGISCPDVDSGEYRVLSAGGYFAMVCGHDHRNAFVGTVDGLMLVASPTCGFGTYGPVGERRASRLIEFDIRHPHEPRTQLLEFGELVGKPSAGKAYTYGLSSQARPEERGDDLLRRPGVWSTMVGALRRWWRA